MEATQEPVPKRQCLFKPTVRLSVQKTEVHARLGHTNKREAQFMLALRLLLKKIIRMVV